MKPLLLALFLIPMTAQAQLDKVIVNGKLVPYSIKLDTIPKEYMKSDSFPKYQVIHGGFSILKLDPQEESSIQQMAPDYFIKLSLVIKGDTAKAIYSLMQYIRSLSPVKNALAPLPSPRPQATTDTLPKYDRVAERYLDGKRFRVKPMVLPAILTFVGGAFDGLNQAISFHYSAVDAKLHLNDGWADPAQSWRRKYKNGDPQQGRRYIGSRTWLVWTTDLYHLTRFGSNLFNAGAITLHFSKRKKWYAYIIEGATYWLCNRVGFSLVYDRF